MMHRLYFYIALLVILSSCGTSKPAAAEITTQQPDEILFVVFEMSKTDSGNIIVLTSTSKGNGKMKPELDRPINSGNYLTLEIFENDRLISTRHLEHPLLKNVEYLNENNQFSTKAVALEEAEFFIRIQKNGRTKIRIGETLNAKSTNQWQTFTLTP